MSRASEIAYNEIRRRILSGHLAQGTQLKEEELADLCGVSRTPVRDALRRLEAEMLVRRSDTQRTFVPEWPTSEVEEIFTRDGHRHRNVNAAEAVEFVAAELDVDVRHLDHRQCHCLHQHVVDRELHASFAKARIEFAPELQQCIEPASDRQIEVRHRLLGFSQAPSDRLAYPRQLHALDRHTGRWRIRRTSSERPPLLVRGAAVRRMSAAFSYH